MGVDLVVFLGRTDVGRSKLPSDTLPAVASLGDTHLQELRISEVDRQSASASFDGPFERLPSRTFLGSRSLSRESRTLDGVFQ